MNHFTVLSRVLVLLQKKIWRRCGNNEPFYSEENQMHLNAAISRLEAGQGKEHELIDA